MITVRRPSAATVAAYRNERIAIEPPCDPSNGIPPGFHHTRATRTIGNGHEQFQRARLGLQQWQAHRGAGIEIHPHDLPVVEGETVVIVTRQIGLWVVASCRVTNVVDDPATFGFTYATLPDHPERGYESFTVRHTEHGVRFEIEAVSQPGIVLVRLASPIARQIQRRATHAYLDALARFIA